VEVVVVDDGSRDDSLAVARSYEPRGVRVESIANSGAAAARNRGLAVAGGDFFQFLDADDLLAPGKLEHQLVRLLPAGPTVVATCAWARFQENSSEARFIPEALWQDFAPVDWLVSCWQQHLMMATGAWLVPRALADRAGPWNTALGHNPVDDMEYFSRVLLAAEWVLFCGEAQVYYRSGTSDSLSQRRSDDAWRAIFASFQLTVDRLLERENSPRTRRACAIQLQHVVYESYPRVPAERAAAERRIREFGGSEVQPATGPWRRKLQRLIGWKATKRLHDWAYRR
jgi:glycosyltransferase involved in cell wall biosynthesis